MINTGLNEKNSTKVVKILNRVLSDEYVLYTKTKGYHWNVKGTQFNDLHKFFEEQYTELEGIVDDVAERARSVGGYSNGSLTEMLKDTALEEDTTKGTDAKHMVRSLLSDHEAIIRRLRKDLRDTDEKYDDMGTSDFLTGLMETHEKMAWMLRAFLDD